MALLRHGDAGKDELPGFRPIAPTLLAIFHRLEQDFKGEPALLILDEAWLFLDNSLFAAQIKAWLKTLRKKNVSVLFATQSLADVEQSAIAATIIDSCPAADLLAEPARPRGGAESLSISASA